MTEVDRIMSMVDDFVLVVRRMPLVNLDALSHHRDALRAEISEQVKDADFGRIATRRLTGLWRFGGIVLPDNRCDFLGWLVELDKMIDVLLKR